jgi:retrotransposon gag protein
MALREKPRPKSLDEQLIEQITARLAREGQRGLNSPLEVPTGPTQSTMGPHTTGLHTPAPGDPYGAPFPPQKEMMNKPQRFDGDKAKYRVWKMEMQLKLEYDGPLLARRGMYLPSYVISFLDGDAGSFALHRLPDILSRIYPMERLWKEFDLRFGDPFLRRRAQNQYSLLKQGNKSFNEFFLEFERLSIEAGKADNPDNVKIDDLRDRISHELTQLMIHKEETTDYAEFVQQLHDVDTRFQAAKSRNAFRYPLIPRTTRTQGRTIDASSR